MRRSALALVGLLASTLVAPSVPALAANEGIRPDLRATILLRAMAYERNLTSRQGDLKLVLIVGHSAASTADATTMRTAFADLAGRLRIAGRRLVIGETHDAADANLVAKLQRDGADLVYAATNSVADMQQLSGSLHGGGGVFLCADVEEVGHGCLMAVEQVSGKPRIVIHLGLAHQLALNFDSRLLQLTRVVP
jgi:D-arabinose 1-dehydrogenase-like Zn-dependent alcohol dehydrogenase